MDVYRICSVADGSDTQHSYQAMSLLSMLNYVPRYPVQSWYTLIKQGESLQNDRGYGKFVCPNNAI